LEQLAIASVTAEQSQSKIYFKDIVKYENKRTKTGKTHTVYASQFSATKESLTRA